MICEGARRAKVFDLCDFFSFELYVNKLREKIIAGKLLKFRMNWFDPEKRKKEEANFK